MRVERPILLRFLNVLTSLNDFIIKRIVFLFLVKYIASGTLMCRCSNGSLSLKQWSTPQISQPYKIMGTTIKVSTSFSRRIQGLFKPSLFLF